MANKSGASKESQAATYKSSRRWETNRLARLLRAQKRHPNNEQIPLAIKNLHYRRKTPSNPTWGSSKRRIASVVREFKGVFHPDIFSANDKVSGPALTLAGPRSTPMKYDTFGMFSLEARAVVTVGHKF